MSRYARPALTPEQLAAGRAEARRQVKKRLRHGYTAWDELRNPDGLYYCACREGCKRGVYAYGQINTKCEDASEYAGARERKAREDDLLARMRARNAAKRRAA